MKRWSRVCLVLLSIVLFGWLGFLWVDRFTGTSKIELSGLTGVPFEGYIVESGKRVPVAGALPWSFEGTNVTRIELRKVNPADSFEYRFLHKSVGDGLSEGEVRPSDAGVKVRLGHRSMHVRFIKHDT